jgi:glutathione S-transferase
MKLFHSVTSPYVRKVSVCAIELGLEGRIERLPGQVSPVARNAEVAAHNPLAKIPTLITDEGLALFDSRVICEYLDALDGRHRLIPASGIARWRVLRDQALGDGLLDASALSRYETALRPAELRWSAWLEGQMQKIQAALDMIDAEAPGFGERVDVGTIACACALGYLDFRFPDLGWRAARPRAAAWYERFAQRPSMRATVPVG